MGKLLFHYSLCCAEQHEPPPQVSSAAAASSVDTAEVIRELSNRVQQGDEAYEELHYTCEKADRRAGQACALVYSDTHIGFPDNNAASCCADADVCLSSYARL